MRYSNESRRRLLGWLLCAALPCAATALPARAEGGPAELDVLLARLANVPGVSAHFREEKKLALLTLPLVSEGELAFTRPPTLVRRVTLPEPSSMLLREGRLETWDASGKRTLDLSAYPGARILAESFLQVLAGNRAELARNYDMRMSGSLKAGWALTLTPKVKALAQLVRELSVEGTDLTLKSLRIIEASGDVSTTQFSAVDTQRRFSAEERRTIFSLPGGE